MSALDLPREALAELWSHLTLRERLLALRWFRRRHPLWALFIEQHLTGSPTIARTCENTCVGGDRDYRRARRRAYRAAWMRRWREEQAKKRGGS